MTYANNGQESGVFKDVSGLAKAFGLAAAILGTPAIYNHTRVPMLSYLTETWGHTGGQWLTWAMAGVEAYALYRATRLIFTSGIVWTMTKAASRRFPGV